MINDYLFIDSLLCQSRRKVMELYKNFARDKRATTIEIKKTLSKYLSAEEEEKLSGSMMRSRAFLASNLKKPS